MTDPKTVTPEMTAALEAPLPKEAVSQHPTKKFLSSIKGIYITERINEVFGIGNWRTEVKIIENTGEMVVLHVMMHIPEYGIEVGAFGGNNNPDRGDAYKGAESDALSKIAAVYLNIGLDVFKGQFGKKQNISETDFKTLISNMNAAKTLEVAETIHKEAEEKWNINSTQKKEIFEILDNKQ